MKTGATHTTMLRLLLFRSDRIHKKICPLRSPSIVYAFIKTVPIKILKKLKYNYGFLKIYLVLHFNLRCLMGKWIVKNYLNFDRASYLREIKDFSSLNISKMDLKS